MAYYAANTLSRAKYQRDSALVLTVLTLEFVALFYFSRNCTIFAAWRLLESACAA